jgi:hypothetical protein
MGEVIRIGVVFFELTSLNIGGCPDKIDFFTTFFKFDHGLGFGVPGSVQVVIIVNRTRCRKMLQDIVTCGLLDEYNQLWLKL